jgi:preprotein translocase subunit SecY
MAGNALVNIFRTHELRQRVLFTLGMLFIFRLGATIPLPGIDFIQLQEALKAPLTGTDVNLLDYLDLFVGGAFRNFSICMLGVMPYITSSIIIQLLVVVVPRLKKLSQEEGGQAKVKRYMRYATVILCLIQGYFLITSQIHPKFIKIGDIEFKIIALLSVTAGSIFLMWIGEQITQRGVGNGVSLIIFAGIVIRIPDVLIQLGLFKSFLNFIEGIGTVLGILPRRGILVPLTTRSTNEINPVFVLIALIMFVVVVALIIYEQRGQRKIPVHYAKRVIGRKIYGSQNTYLPFKLNPSGVIPIIFANALLIAPLQLFQSLGQNIDFFAQLARIFRPNGPGYLIAYSLLIIFFAYFYTQVTLNPADISKQIREHGGSIPGIRSEKMEEYLVRILNRIILPGSIFLAFIAIIPNIVTNLFGFPYSVSNIMGGTSLIILVGVGLDTMSQMESYLRMHHQEGLVKKGKIRARNL